MKFLLFALAILLLFSLAQGQDLDGTLDTCLEQSKCTKLTIDPEENGPTCSGGGDNGCQYKVCLKIDTSPGSECSKDEAISHYCAKADDNTMCASDSVWGTNTEGHSETVVEQCQYAGPGQDVVFLMKDGGSCSGEATIGATMDLPTSLDGSASCAPSEGATCTGNAAGKECVWTVTTPPCVEELAPPTPAPVNPTVSPTEWTCPIDFGVQGDTLCPGEGSAVTLLGKSTSGDAIYPDGYDITKIFYQMSTGGTTSAPELSFKVFNPFEDTTVGMYVTYQDGIEGLTDSVDNVCYAKAGTIYCDEEAATITTRCKNFGGAVTSHAMITVSFVASELSAIGGTNTPYECCDAVVGDQDGVIEYHFRVLCGCESPEPADHSGYCVSECI